MNTVEVLTKARAILAKRGVLRDGNYAHDDTGPCCSYGAISFAAGATWDGSRLNYDDTDWEVIEAAEDILRATLLANPETSDARYGHTARWNDNSPNDEKVLAMFDRAIEMARNSITEKE